MNKLILIAALIALAGCTSKPIPPEIQAKVDAIPAAELPTHFMAERDLCGSRAGDAKTACREKVRRDYLARQMMREQGAN